MSFLKFLCYLILEKMMFAADGRGDEKRAEVIREHMDDLWYGMSDGQRRFLNNRR